MAARKKPVYDRYMKIPPFVQAAQVTRATAAAVAEWCGGSTFEDSAGRIGVVVPKVPPPHNKAHSGSLDWDIPGDFVVQDESGKFRVAQGSTFLAQYVIAPEKT